jgi:hypothetical protein
MGTSFVTDQERQLYGDGSGVLDTTGVTSASTTIVGTDVTYIREGMYVDIWDTSGSAYIEEDMLVSSVDPVNNTFVVDTSCTTEAGDLVYRAGNKDLEITGFSAMVADDNTYLGIDRTAAGMYLWQSYVDDCSSAAIDLPKLDEFWAVMIYKRDSKCTLCLCEEQVIRWLKQLYQGQGIPLDYLTINLGYKAIAYNHPKGRTPFVVSQYMPKKTIYLLDERFITIRQPQDTHWMPGYDGFWRLVEGYDKEVATLRKYWELFNVNPQTCGKLHNFGAPA